LKELILRRRRGTFTELWALNNVDLDIAPGECVGVVGQNGAGKSTMLKLVAGILQPQRGTVEVAGNVASLLELGAGFHPDFTGRENIFMNAAIHGLAESKVDELLDEIVGFAEIEEFLDMPVKTYSSGMQMRLGFAIAMHVDADILLIDEVLAVGDESFQRKCLGRIFEFKRAGGTLLIVSHDASSIERVCDRAVLIWDGAIVHDGNPLSTLAEYHKRLAESPAGDRASAEISNRLDPNQWGSGEMQITDLVLLTDGHPTNSVLSGADLEVRITVRANRTIQDPVFGLAIKTPDGITCFGSNTDLEGQPTGTFSGEHSFVVKVPKLSLHEGRFVVHASAVSTDLSRIYHWLENQCEFSVIPAKPGIGVTSLDFAWSFDA
jgi:ABC-type polysaccharide/polyol phosphate transport system ATPase subunit